MIKIYSLYKNGIYYGGFTNLKHAEMVQVAYKEQGIDVEIEPKFVYTKLYEVKAKIDRIKT